MKLGNKIFLPLIAIILTVFLFIGFFSRESIVSALLKESFYSTKEHIQEEITFNLKPEYITDPTSNEAQQGFAYFQEELGTASIARTTIWNKDKTIIYSDLSQIIGFKAASHHELERALSGDEPSYIFRQKDIGNPMQSDVGEFIDIYVPIKFEGQVMGVVQVHSVVSAIIRPVEKQLNLIMYALTFGGISIYFIIYFIFKYFIIIPVRQMSISADEIATGNFERPIESRSTDEIGKMARDFDQMRLRIKNLLLEQKEKADKFEIVNLSLSSTIKELNDTKSAMINLMEDLNLEKFGVEEKVREQTKTLREERARFLASVNSLKVGFAIVDNDGVITLSNPALRRILALETVPSKLSDISGILKQEIDLYGRLKVCLNDKCEINEKDISFGDRFLHLFLTPVFTEGESVYALGGVLLIEDITEAKKIDKAKTELVSLASHQLRTPLTAINWFTEMLVDEDAGKLNKEQKKYLNEIYKGNQRMVGLVNALLDASRIELGTFQVNPEPTDINKTLRSVIDEVQNQIAEKNIDFKENIDPDIQMNADPKLIRMVFQNLLTNAVKYTPSGGKVSVSLNKLSKGSEFANGHIDEDSLGFVCRDSGYGIPKNQQDKVFNRLFRADNVRALDTEGTGLGLYIVKSIIDQAGGKIHMDSEENKGTTFFVSIPLSGMKKTPDRPEKIS